MGREGEREVGDFSAGLIGLRISGLWVEGGPNLTGAGNVKSPK